MKQRKALSAVLDGKCPRCRQGEVFAYPLWKITKFNSTLKNCPHCGLQYEVEPGFFFGAMYVSYAFSVAIFISVVVFLNIVLGDPGLVTYILSVTVVSMITYPINFRLSRLLFLHLFSGIRYDPGK